MLRTAATLGAALALISCGGREVSDTSTKAAPPTSEAWSTLAGTRVYFGHQSVGGNILQGLSELGAGQGTPLTVVRSPAAAPGQPALVEFAIGENGAPASKQDAFVSALAPLGDSASGVAMFKYCYLDIGPRTDVDALFARHRETVRTLRQRHPGLTLVHVTAPLTIDEPASKRLVKQVLGKPTSRDANAKRAAFNAMIRREYAGEPIFDLARVESTHPDGSRAHAGDVEMLAPEYTDDGGHLNAAGRRAAAAELVRVLASAAAAGTSLTAARSAP